MVYNVSNPPVVIYNAIEDLSNITVAANLKKSQQQIINYGVDLLKYRRIQNQPYNMVY